MFEEVETVGGNLGQIGCVSFMFDKKGQIIIDDTLKSAIDKYYDEYGVK